MVFHPSVFLNVSSNFHLMRKFYDIDCKKMFFSPECVLKCFFKSWPCEKALGHWLQGNGISPEHVLKCSFKCDTCVKAFQHWLQGNDFSPECVLKSIFKLLLSEKALEHWLQRDVFSPVWVLEWVSILLMLVIFLANKCKNKTFPLLRFSAINWYVLCVYIYCL